MSHELPIGIFDSGVGGLTVMKEIISHLPDEDIVYLGDTARVPYGVRSPETVLRYSIEVAQFLVDRGIKILIIACNTSSAVSVPQLQETFPVPVIGVVEPGARAAVKATSTKKIAVTGTETTINSSSYKRAIKSIDSSIEVTGVACPLFVPLIEEGWLEGEVVTLVAEKYLSSIKSDGADTLVLGCTHYPMIKKVIGDTVGMEMIDSAIETAKEVRKVLEKDNLLRSGNGKPLREFFVTDDPGKFSQVGQGFLGSEILNISRITL